MRFDSQIVSNVSMFETFQPLIPVAREKISAKIPAITTPETVPSVAVIVLRLIPPMHQKVRMVVRAQITTAERIGETRR